MMKEVIKKEVINMKFRSNVQLNTVSVENNAFVSGSFAASVRCCMCCCNTGGLQRCPDLP